MLGIISVIPVEIAKLPGQPGFFFVDLVRYFSTDQGCQSGHRYTGAGNTTGYGLAVDIADRALVNEKEF